MKSIVLTTPVRFKGQHRYGIVNKYTSSHLPTTECANYAVTTICDPQIIISAIKMLFYIHGNSPLQMLYGVVELELTYIAAEHAS